MIKLGKTNVSWLSKIETLVTLYFSSLKISVTKSSVTNSSFRHGRHGRRHCRLRRRHRQPPGRLPLRRHFTLPSPSPGAFNRLTRLLGLLWGCLGFQQTKNTTKKTRKRKKKIKTKTVQKRKQSSSFSFCLTVQQSEYYLEYRKYPICKCNLTLLHSVFIYNVH